MLVNVMGDLPAMRGDNFVLYGDYALASPLAHVTKDDAPVMIFILTMTRLFLHGKPCTCTVF